MKSCWSISILLFSFISTFAQYNVTDSFPSPVISLNQWNVVYVGIENPFRVAVPGYSSDQIELKVRGGEIKKKDDNYYLNVWDTRGKVREAVISVFVRENDSLIFIDKHTFRIKRVPNLEPCFGSKTSGEISAAEAQQVNFIRFKNEGFYYDLNIRVQQYNFLFQPVNGSPYVENVKGGIITETIKEKLMQLKKGDIIIFQSIFYRAEGISYKQLPGAIVLTIK